MCAILLTTAKVTLHGVNVYLDYMRFDDTALLKKLLPAANVVSSLVVRSKAASACTCNMHVHMLMFVEACRCMHACICICICICICMHGTRVGAARRRLLA